MNKLKLFSFLFVFLTVSINAQKLYYPEDKWEEKNPEALGLDNEKIKAAVRRTGPQYDHGGPRGHTMW